jgi:hypothetical protein
MIGLIEGAEANNVQMFKGGNKTLKCMVINDDGTPRDITALTMSAIIYKNKTRDNTLDPILTKAGVIVTATAGYFTASFLAADMIFDPGTYYIYLKEDNAGVVSFSEQPAKLTVT